MNTELAFIKGPETQLQMNCNCCLLNVSIGNCLLTHVGHNISNVKINAALMVDTMYFYSTHFIQIIVLNSLISHLGAQKTFMMQCFIVVSTSLIRNVLYK